MLKVKFSLALVGAHWISSWYRGHMWGQGFIPYLAKFSSYEAISGPGLMFRQQHPDNYNNPCLHKIKSPSDS